MSHFNLGIKKFATEDSKEYTFLNSRLYQTGAPIEGHIMRSFFFFYVLLTVHLSINLVNDQLYTQFFYFIICLLQSSTCFVQRRAHRQEVKLY